MQIVQNKKASSIIEYALAVSVILVVLLSLRSFVQKSLMYKYKDAGDAIGHGRQNDSKFNFSSF